MHRCMCVYGRSILRISYERQAHFKCHATAVPNSIDQIKFDLSTAVLRRLKPSCATAV